MAPGIRGRKLSFEILSTNTSGLDEETIFHRSNSDPSIQVNVDSLASESKPTQRKRKNKYSRNKKKKNFFDSAISEDSIDQTSLDLSHSVQQKLAALENGNCTGLEESWRNCRVSTVVCDQICIPEENGSSSSLHSLGEVSGHQNLQNSDGYMVAELRQRNVSAIWNGEVLGTQDDDQNVPLSQESGTGAEEDQDNLLSSKLQSEHNGPTRKLDTSESLDWKKLLEQDANYSPLVEKSPLKYFMEEMSGGNSLRSTTTSGNDKERERVYDTMFRLPWRCELLIDFGFLVCLDSFLSLLTIMPIRMLVSFWRFFKLRKFERPSVAELSDFGCFIALVCGVGLLQQTDISLIYHMIRGQGTVKLYVVYNILEIFDKLCQSFGGEVLQTLFNSAEGLANCPSENMGYWTWRFILDETLTLLSSIVHSFILLAQAITLSTCIVAHNNALLALLVSNNFAEIKSNVFKRFSKDNIQSMVYYDSVERFHILAFLLFVLAQNILEAEGPWFETFVSNALTVYFCEVIIDIIKHSFIAKFNDIKPITYSEFLEDLCKQTLNIPAENEKRSLTFIPLAPACVVIRVVSPVYAAHLPYGPFAWRVFWMLILSGMTFVMLVTLKIMIGMGLERHARWYIKRCQKRKLHSD
ncbi:protein POLLEN DEFECTIVE IN GUIDANCE 1 [Impatiens glandulifera]|uniref:protein POLLEN DEFECTIVE IN GUIDANCE 1 n=1 Tax=Impatiens glandulifera TaxID=253017 RepID=UPI001FB120D3|nr:protein POLLEN DEFECTIVE IN GUIDANCE 1 [Impatiens glandulifera]